MRPTTLQSILVVLILGTFAQTIVAALMPNPEPGKSPVPGTDLNAVGDAWGKMIHMLTGWRVGV